MTDNKGLPVSNVGVCFKIYCGAVPGLPGPAIGGELPVIMPGEVSFTSMKGSDGVTAIKQATGIGTQKLHIRA